jgi:hypothetical protein
MAQRKLEIIAPEREVQAEAIRAELLAKGDVDAVRRLDAAEADVVKAGWTGGHPMDALVENLTDQLTTAMRDLDASPERLASLCVTMVLQEDVSAQLVSFEDGSGMVQMSDAAMSLCSLYAQVVGSGLAGIGSRTRLGGMWQAFRAARKGRVDLDPELLTGLLRYYNIHQRLFGLAGKLGLQLAPAAEPMAALIGMQAWLFVLGHEMAHHVLGHELAPSGSSTACSADRQRELDADQLAYAAVSRTKGSQFGMGPLSALTAMFALHSTEQALFLRLGNTHPPAPVRAAHLLDRLSEKEQKFAAIVASDLQTATDASSSFGPNTPAFDWTTFLANPVIGSPHSSEYLSQIPVFDAAQCQSSDQFVRFFHRMDEDEGTNLAPTAERARRGDAEGALTAWGTPASVVATLCDMSSPLTFHTLFGSLRTTTKADTTIPARAEIAVAISAAMLVAPTISGTPSGGQP